MGKWIKTMIAAYFVSGLMLAIIAFLMYKFQIGTKAVYGAVMMTYIVSNLVGGLIMGKIMKEKKFMWGMMTGIVYFLILTIISVIVTGGIYEGGVMEAVTALACCSLGGMAGGMMG